MNIEQLKEKIPDYAKDIRLNLANVLTDEGAIGLSAQQRYSIALACAYASKNSSLITAITNDANEHLRDQDRQAAKSAAALMAMNNIYYRFTHLVSDKSYSTMPAALRMNVMHNPGINKLDFELNCLAISAINGCGLCIDAHTRVLTNAGIDKKSIQSTIRIAAVINAVALSIEIQ